jgi:uncharacterized Zn finger protein
MFGIKKKKEEEIVEVVIAPPKCPSCDVKGEEYIYARNLILGSRKERYEIVQCTECGHVYGTFTRVVDATTYEAFS